MQKIDSKSIPGDVLEHYRFQAIALKKKKWKIDKIAEAFGVHRCTIAHWVTKEKRFGKESLDTLKKEKPDFAFKDFNDIDAIIRVLV